MYAEKLLPHDLEAEEAVVGSVLIDGDCFSRVAPYIKADDFYRERNQLCFAACEALFQRDEAIDQVTLARELSRRAVKPGAAEQEQNPRSRSAQMRAMEKL